MNEIWIETENKHYLVSSTGKVRREAHHIFDEMKSGNLRRRFLPDKELKPYKNHDGYMRVSICRKFIFVHSLVAASFIGKKPEGMQVCHINGNPADNRLENLRYGTPRSNVLDRIEHGTYQYGERNPFSKLDACSAFEIFMADGVHEDIAKNYGVSDSTISLIKNGRSWGHIYSRLKGDNGRYLVKREDLS